MIADCAEAVPASTLVAARARLGRARYNEHNYQEAEALLRPSLAESSAAGPGQWPTEALSRFFLASTLVRVDRFQEAREILQPLVESRDQEHLASALLLLGLIGRVEFSQLFEDSKLPEARDRLASAAESLRQAKIEAARTADQDVLLEAGQELEKLDGLLRTMRQRPEFAVLLGAGGGRPGIQAERAPEARAITARADAAPAAMAAGPPPTDAVVAGTEPAGTEPAGTDPAGTEPAGTEPAGTEPAGTDPAGTDPAGTEPAGTDPAGTDPAGTDPAGTDPAGTDPAGTDPAGTDPAGTDPAKRDPAKTARPGTAACTHRSRTAPAAPGPHRKAAPAPAMGACLTSRPH